MKQGFPQLTRQVGLVQMRHKYYYMLVLLRLLNFSKDLMIYLHSTKKVINEAVQRLAIEQQGRRRRDEYQDGVIRLPLPSQNP